MRGGLHVQTGRHDLLKYTQGRIQRGSSFTSQEATFPSTVHVKNVKIHNLPIQLLPVVHATLGFVAMEAEVPACGISK